MDRRKLFILGVGMFVSLASNATPSGLKAIPTDVVIPNLEGNAVPVELLPHHFDKNTVYVKPLEGEFVSQGVVKSPIADCQLIKEELKIADINAKARVELARMLQQSQLDYQKRQDEFNEIVKQYEKLAALVPPYETIVSQAEDTRKELLNDIKSLKDEKSALQDLLALEEDPDKIKELQDQIAAIDREISRLKRDFIKASKELREARATLNALKIELAEAEGKQKGMQKTLLIQTEELTRIQNQLNLLQEQSDKVLKRYSERVGGYTTFTSEFAPSSYIQALKKANPNYQFQYVPSVTATVDATLPGNIQPGSPLEARIGSLILSAKWSDPQSAALKKVFRKHLLEGVGEIKDPVKFAQTRMPELESSLSGTKFLSMELSILGYCALREPHALESQFVGGAADTFKLALYYTYPMNYAIRLQGRYNSYATLYEMYKVTNKSSWFGLSRKQKREHIRNLTNSTHIDVKVDPIGMELGPQDSLLLAEKVKEQLVFFSVERHLDKTGMEAMPRPQQAPLGASTVGKRLMMVPNPYAFWTGLVLTSLGEMFGSSSIEDIKKISESSWVNLNYDAGFSFLVAGDITIGDLKRAPLVEQ